MAVVWIDGVTECAVCSGKVKLKQWGESVSAVHFDGTPLCESRTHVAPLADYIVPTESLRDRMAMAALTGMVSRGHGKAQEYAFAAYVIADAMLEERVREKKTDGRDAAGVEGSGVRIPVGDEVGPAPGGEKDVARRTWPPTRRGSSEHD